MTDEHTHDNRIGREDLEREAAAAGTFIDPERDLLREFGEQWMRETRDADTGYREYPMPHFDKSFDLPSSAELEAEEE